MSHVAPSERVVSMDQFRGYTVAGMILINFIDVFVVVPSVFKHNDNYFSLADSIMPSFHFAVGFSYRLTMLRRLAELGTWKTYLSYIRRSVALVFIAVLFFGVGEGFRSWQQFQRMPATLTSERHQADRPSSASDRAGANDDDDEEQSGSAARRLTPWNDPGFRETFVGQWRVYLAKLLKSKMWNTFAIIGVTQLVILPFVAARSSVRVLALIGFALGHALLTYWFNWGFVLGYEDNWMVRIWKTGSTGSIDGGFFGPLCWAVPMLAGTLAYHQGGALDPVPSAGQTRSTRCSAGLRSARRLLVWGAVFGIVAYALSCLTRLYDVEYGAVARPERKRDAASPVVPSFASVKDRSLGSLLAEPPFVAPPRPSVRLENYWMMTKKIPSLSFILFSTGFAMTVYALFVLVCDVGGFQLGLFRTFGTNPLAAYCIHHLVVHQMHRLFPSDSPLWYVLIGFVAFLGTTYLCVRSLEKHNVYIRL